MKHIKKLSVMILVLLLCGTFSVPGVAYGADNEIDAYKDYIAIELNAELYNAMNVTGNDISEKYAGAYIDDFGNYHVCVTEEISQQSFEEILNEDTVAEVKQEAMDGAQLSRSAMQELQNTEVIYDIKNFSYSYLENILNVLTENMEELGIHRVAIKQKDNVVDIFTEDDLGSGIITFLSANITDFEESAVRFNIEENNQSYMAAQTMTPYSGNEIKCYLGNTIYTSTIGFHAVDSWGDAGVITAGHGAPEDSTAMYSGKTLGTTQSSSLGGKLDCAFIPFSNTSSVTWETSVFVNEVDTTTYNGLSEIATESRVVEGARTEKYGIVSGKTFGTIENTSVSFSVTDGGVTTKFTDFVRIDDGSDHGDSGGTIGLRAKTAKAKLYLLGITSSGNSTTTNVCKASNIVDAYGLDAVTF